jgi:hypothetical protein
VGVVERVGTEESHRRSLTTAARRRGTELVEARTAQAVSSSTNSANTSA